MLDAIRYADLDTMWCDAVKEILTRGRCRTASRDGDMAGEVIGWRGILNDPLKCWVTNPRRCASPYYWAAEVLWYLSGNSETKMMEAYAPQYKRFAEEDGKAYGAYGGRLSMFCDQLAQLVIELRDRPDSRRAVLGFWHPLDIRAACNKVKDVPCTLTLQLIQRNGFLHALSTMRSQDVWLGMPYDVPWFCFVQTLVAHMLGVQLGELHHSVGSMHAYVRNEKACFEACVETDPMWRGVDAPPGQVWGCVDNLNEDLASIREAVVWESIVRSGVDQAGMPDSQMGRMGLVLSGLCERWLTGEPVPEIHLSPALVTAMQMYDAKHGQPTRKVVTATQ